MALEADEKKTADNIAENTFLLKMVILDILN